MAISTATWTTSAAQDWASDTWQTTDPSYLLNTELSSWINAINNTAIIEMVANPGTATSRADADYVQWVLRAREADTTSDWGILFHRRYAGTSSVNMGNRLYYGRTAGTANNGYGSYTALNATNAAFSEDFSAAGTAFVAYEPTGTRPWFVYSWRNTSNTGYSTHILARLDTSDLVAGGYYPASGVSKWMYLYGGEVGGVVARPIRIAVPVKDSDTNQTPVRAFGTSNGTLAAWIPDLTRGTGYFAAMQPQFGYNHYLGRPTDDFLISNASTGTWGDTVTIASKTYTSIGGFWVRTS